MFVNCGVTHPQPMWLERLHQAGRLVVPFTMAVSAQIGHGVMTKIVRHRTGYSAAMVNATGIFSGGSLRDGALEPLMKNALTTGRLLMLESVRRDAHEPCESCVLHAAEVCLSTAPLSPAATA